MLYFRHSFFFFSFYFGWKSNNQPIISRVKLNSIHLWSNHVYFSLPSSSSSLAVVVAYLPVYLSLYLTGLKLKPHTDRSESNEYDFISENKTKNTYKLRRRRRRKKRKKEMKFKLVHFNIGMKKTTTAPNVGTWTCIIFQIAQLWSIVSELVSSSFITCLCIRVCVCVCASMPCGLHVHAPMYHEIIIFLVAYTRARIHSLVWKVA